MPTITIDGPPIADTAIKRELVRDITDAAEKAYGIPREAYVVLIREYTPENVGIGGVLLFDRR
ncbi:MAG: 4-oxalocrotonate tautomerase [Candidatus Aegiribacteria sp. MLS_C]|nr:MAG: 4-oxalocrotonate tautomerase [Candidatus Aegiribacteria sp. MLS_C]